MYNKLILLTCQGVGSIDERKYLAELEKLLSFMSSWDRQAALERYEAMFDEAKDPQALIEELGTPTKVAVELANGYVSSLPPGAAVETQEQSPEMPIEPESEDSSAPQPEAERFSEAPEENAVSEPNTEVPEAAQVPDETADAEQRTRPEEAPTQEDPPAQEDASNAEADRPSGEEAPAQEGIPAPDIPHPMPEEATSDGAEPAVEAPEAEERHGANGFVKLLYWLFVILIGIGIPFLAAGVWVIYTVIHIVPGALAGFTLLSDTLLLGGAGLALLAFGLFLAWFGLWLSISLCRLWIGKALFALGNRVMHGQARS